VYLSTQGIVSSFAPLTIHHIPQTSASDPDMDRIRIQMGQKMEVEIGWKRKTKKRPSKKKKNLFSNHYFLHVSESWGIFIFFNWAQKLDLDKNLDQKHSP
jgi:hypothetical protein